jgi:hypothetical protein
MAFQGSLTELHLPDIIQLVSVSGKTGVFHLVDGPHKGEIYLHEGRIVHAQLDETGGEEAVYALAIWSKGDFRFDQGVATDQHTISKSNTNLLMEAARRLDEWRVLSKKIPSTDLVPEFVVQDHREGQISLNTSEWLILSKIDGHRTIKQMASASGLSVFDVSKILYGLLASNLIRLRDAGPPSRPVPRPGAAAGAARPAAPAPGASAPASSASSASSAGGAAPAPAPAGLATRLERMREICNGMLGPVGESAVNKHYLKAKAEIEKGAGFEAIEEAINQIARASSILRGPSTTEALLEQLKAVR